MPIKIDAEKLAKLIAEEVPHTTGCCVTTGMCIGKIRGKQIQIVIQADLDEFMAEKPEFTCVSGKL